MSLISIEDKLDPVQLDHQLFIPSNLNFEKKLDLQLRCKFYWIQPDVSESSSSS